jgi:phosphatidylinositol-3-phosphatase
MRALYIFLVVFLAAITACSTQQPNTATPAPIVPPLSEPPPTPNAAIPNFDHIAIVIFENTEYDSVIGSAEAPVINQLAEENTLLTEFYAVTHPSLPNYVALIGGDTYGYTETCKNCPVTATNLADLIERSGRTWRSYQENMPYHCSMWDPTDRYAPKHNPFLYYSSVLNDTERCRTHVVDLDDLEEDAAEGTLPNFLFITPNMCNIGHDCPLGSADIWLGDFLPALEKSLQAQGDNYLIVVTWDEGETKKSCCGLPDKAGGRIATILISPRAKNGYQDATPYTTYSLLRTISEAWGLPLLGHAADAGNVPILASWE